MHGAQNTCLNAYHIPRKKCTCTCACTPMQRCRNFFVMETIANSSLVLREHRAGCRFPPALATLPAVLTKPVAWRCSLKKSVQIHASSRRGRRCCVAQASFDHPCWCRPHPVCLWVALVRGHRAHPSKNSIFAMVLAGFLCWASFTSSNWPSFVSSRTKWLSWSSNDAVSFDASALPHYLSPSLDCFCQNFPEVSVDLTTTPTCCPLLALFVRTQSSLLASLFVGSKLCSLRLTSNNSNQGSSSPSVVSSFLKHIMTYPVFALRPSVQFFSSYLVVSFTRPTASWVLANPLVSKYRCISCRFFFGQSLHYRNYYLNFLLAVRRCTYSRYRWCHHECLFFIIELLWILGKSNVFSNPACLKAGTLFRMAASPAHISSHVGWSNPLWICI